MATYIQTNVASLQAQQNLSMAQSALATNFQQLSSGYKINSAADDAAGLGITTQMDASIGSLSVAAQNTSDGVSMAQTADGALSQMSTMVERLQQLAVQGSNGDMTASDRGYLDTEFQSVASEISRTSASTQYNGQTLLSGAANTVNFQVGINNTANDQIGVSFGGVDLTTLGLQGIGVSGADATNSTAAITATQGALDVLSTARAGYGAAMDRMQDASANIQSMSTNLTSADAGMKDTDVASAAAGMARNQVLTQAGAAVLAQANQAPQLALKLLGQ
jgi:flagellin